MNYTTPRDILIEKEKIEILENVLNTLSDREKLVINLRTIEGNTFQHIADIVGVSRERIRQIEFKSLRKLRNPKRANIIREAFGLEIPKIEKKTENVIPPRNEPRKRYEYYEKLREDKKKEKELIDYWRPRIKFTEVYHYHDMKIHPYHWPSSTDEEKRKRILGYAEYYQVPLEELKIIFNEKDMMLVLSKDSNENKS